MIIDFSRLTSTTDKALLEPRDIFMSLPNKRSSYGYPRDVQTDVWKQWYAKRNDKNCIIKMNTGSGKTVVGLMILQSCLNEGKGPAVYVVPDNYLVQQVCDEAATLGIKYACDKFDKNGARIEKGEEDYFFTTKNAILVTNIHKLVNGKSIFGMRAEGNVQIGSIVIDDVHACLDTIEQQYTVRIEAAHPLYSVIVGIFAKHQYLKESQEFYEIVKCRDAGINKLIPFWIWQEDCEEIRRLLMQPEYKDEDIRLFHYPLLSDVWKSCNCVISASGIEITPKSIPISKITSFENADRRIFMSATLADDSIFVSAMGLGEKDVTNIITPEKANDVGDKLILFPKHLNAQIDDVSIRQILSEQAKKYNVVVITPSFERAEFWQELKEIPIQVLSSRDMNTASGVNDLKTGKFKGLTVLVNKYDGIDLPDDACRFLVIDGLPAMRSGYDAVVQGMNPGDKRICRESIQKIEQGMGRGVRSNSDYCVVVLMGDRLADVMVNQDGKQFFSKATRTQYEISRQIWGQLMEKQEKPSAQDVFGLAECVLARDREWVTVSKNALSSVEYDREPNIDSIVVAFRKAFEKESIGRYEEAFCIIEAEKDRNAKLNDNTKGFLIQLMAEYKNFVDPVRAQELLISALKLNKMVLKPVKGIENNKLHSFSDGQAVNIRKYIVDNGMKGNEYLIRVHSVLDSLCFAENTADSFEEAIDQVARLLGIHSSRPDKNGVLGSPDNLWAVDNLEYFVIECKNGVKRDSAAISKADCAQLLSSIQWFENLYAGNDFKCYPIIIHRAGIFDRAASPDPRMRIMNEEKLEQFKEAIRKFAEGIVSGQGDGSTKEIQRLLINYKLNGKAIIDKYTIPGK